jgi:hypothetical protein
MGDERLTFTAFHEAGHVVAQERFGFTPRSCNIERDGNTLGIAHSLDGDEIGGTMNEAGEIVLNPETVQNYVTVCFAGFAAEVEKGRPPRLARIGASADFASCRWHREGMGADGSYRRCFDRAFSFVRDPKNWGAIEMIAAELLEHRHLDGDELSILVDIADGVTGRDDLQAFRQMRDAAMSRVRGRKAE